MTLYALDREVPPLKVRVVGERRVEEGAQRPDDPHVLSRRSVGRCVFSRTILQHLALVVLAEPQEGISHALLPRQSLAPSTTAAPHARIPGSAILPAEEIGAGLPVTCWHASGPSQPGRVLRRRRVPCPKPASSGHMFHHDLGAAELERSGSPRCQVGPREWVLAGSGPGYSPRWRRASDHFTALGGQRFDHFLRR